MLTRSRRERLHAALARLVEEAPDADDRKPEIARHWAAAGRRHIREARVAATRAGELALAAHAADEAREHFTSALALHADDPASTQRERYELLVGYAEACRWSTKRLEMHGATDEAVVLAGRLGDPELVVRAAATASADALWPARAYGERNDAVISVMREALLQLPRDTALRCRLLLALASEAYYAAPPDELDALCEEAVATARRLDDPQLLAEVLMGTSVATIRRSNASRRRRWCEEGLALAARTGDTRTHINMRALLAAIRCELGDVDGLQDEVAELAAHAHDEKLYFVEMVTLTFTHSWAAMRGDQAELDDVFTRLIDCFERVSTSHKIDTVGGAALFVPLWDPTAEAPLGTDIMTYMEESAIPVGPAATVLALRHGQDDAARDLYDAYGIDLETDNWFSPFVWALGAEIGLRLAEPDVAATAYGKLAPYRGTCVVSGTAPAHGPVDAYLAVAAAATGETALASGHADAAVEMIEKWQIPQVEKWFLGLRDRYGF